MIQYILFDLDNTLYSSRYGLEKNVSSRINTFTAAFLCISEEEARRRRLAKKWQYGTCLEWLMTEEGFTDPETYLKAVHPADEAEGLPRDEQLRTFLSGLSIPKAILTNSPHEHADLILDTLGITNMFTHIFDIRQCAYKGKPHPEAYLNALKTLGVSAGETLFIDDSPGYAEGFAALGGKAVLLDENNIHVDCLLPRIAKITEIANHIS